MKVVFTTNSDYNSYSSHNLLKVAINSLKVNTTLEPVVIWDGYQDRTTGWLEDNDIPIIYHELSFIKQIKHFDFNKIQCKNKYIEDMYKHYPEYYNKTFIITESMRMDIPDLFPDEEYVLYCDCDVMFLKDPVFPLVKTPLGVATREDDFFNNGVMLFNIHEYKKYHEDFKKFYIESDYTFAIGDTTTQGAYNTFFKGLVTDIGLENNWHSFFGVNRDASIIHFCGPKPNQLKKLIDNNTTYDILFKSCLNDHSKHYVELWYMYQDELLKGTK
jgi:lipopolysaccharide biosynthesis glycosyltransferase